MTQTTQTTGTNPAEMTRLERAEALFESRRSDEREEHKALVERVLTLVKNLRTVAGAIESVAHAYPVDAAGPSDATDFVGRVHAKVVWGQANVGVDHLIRHLGLISDAYMESLKAEISVKEAERAG